MLYMTEMVKGRAVRPESKNMAQKQSGFPRNLGDPAVSTGLSAFGVADQCTPGLPLLRSWAVGANPRRTEVVPPNEGNRARRDGRQEVAALHSTVDPGEPVPRGPW